MTSSILQTEQTVTRGQDTVVIAVSGPEWTDTLWRAAGWSRAAGEAGGRRRGPGRNSWGTGIFRHTKKVAVLAEPVGPSQKLKPALFKSCAFFQFFSLLNNFQRNVFFKTRGSEIFCSENR